MGRKVAVVFACYVSANPAVSFSLGGVNLRCVSSCRDLVLLSLAICLSLCTHDIDNIVAKAHQRSDAIHRCFLHRNVSLLVYVGPLVEYNCCLVTSLKQDINSIVCSEVSLSVFLALNYIIFPAYNFAVYIWSLDIQNCLWSCGYAL